MADVGANDKLVFGAGTLTVPTGGEPVGVLQEVGLNISFSPITLQGSYNFPASVAAGPGTVKGTAKNGTLDLTLLGSVLGLSAGVLSAKALGSIAPLALTFTAPIYGASPAATVTLTIHAIVFTKWSVQFKNTAYLAQDLEFDCFQDATGQVITIAIA